MLYRKRQVSRLIGTGTNNNPATLSNNQRFLNPCIEIIPIFWIPIQEQTWPVNKK